MKQKFEDLAPRIITATILLLFFIITYLYFPLLLSIGFATTLLIILVYEWPKLGPWWVAPFFPTLPFVFLILLNQSSARKLLLFMFTLSALFDSAGYFFGKLYGKHPLAPTISPSKTWEGLVAGFLVAFLTGPLLMHALHMKSLGLLTLPFIALYCFLALAGGLVVSKLKRRVRLKDSSSLLPGHGG